MRKEICSPRIFGTEKSTDPILNLGVSRFQLHRQLTAPTKAAGCREEAGEARRHGKGAKVGGKIQETTRNAHDAGKVCPYGAGNAS